jgi:pimeloyl-ACP methyl ester carboxylesterase
VIATSPSHVRWGATAANKPAWLLNGKPLPFVDPVAVPDFQPSSISHDGQEYASYSDWYIYQLKHSPNVDDALIPVEDVDCPMLLFSGLDDRLWPSAIAADVIEKKRNAVSKPVENIQYKDVGHVIPLPDESPKLFAWHDAVKAGIAYGGNRDASVSAAKDRWERVLVFLETIDKMNE